MQNDMLDEIKGYFREMEVYEDRYFTVFHDEYGELEIKVSTLKSNYGGYYHHALATQKTTGKIATGNPGETVRDALCGIHWFDLE